MEKTPEFLVKANKKLDTKLLTEQIGFQKGGRPGLPIC